MKTMIHQKYLKKLENLQNKHNKQLAKLKMEFGVQFEDLTMQLSEMANETIRVQNDAALK